MTDDLRPRGAVEVDCGIPECEWSFWIEATDPRLPDGPFICPGCEAVLKEEEMFKHANTVFPNDRVRDNTAKTKTAQEARRGSVVTADPETGKVKVAWDGGGEEWLDADGVVKE